MHRFILMCKGCAADLCGDVLAFYVTRLSSPPTKKRDFLRLSRIVLAVFLLMPELNVTMSSK